MPNFNTPVHLDCTLRDGGYYNSWDFSFELVESYLKAIDMAGVDIVEVGFRTLDTSGFKGPYAFSRDDFLASLPIPSRLRVSVMVNGCELLGDTPQGAALAKLFPNEAKNSRVDLVRIACHFHEIERVYPAVEWLKLRGYQVGLNLMQISERSESEIVAVASSANEKPVDVLYFADSMGSMVPDQISDVIGWFRKGWNGAMGIHTHENLGLALPNTMMALGRGVSWLDSTVSGMGRGPGNARTEELAIELGELRRTSIDIAPLVTVLRQHFIPMREKYKWGTNTFYYLAGKYGIHPTYIQEMLADPRYTESDLFQIIDYLKGDAGKKFSPNLLTSGRLSNIGFAPGSWHPVSILRDRDVLLIGAGKGGANHRQALESYLRRSNAIALVLNTSETIEASLVAFRVACHPVRLKMDLSSCRLKNSPLILPLKNVPESVRNSSEGLNIKDYGMNVEPGKFEFNPTHCTVPTPMAIAYALAICASGRAKRILLAGFDGYGLDDPRTADVNELFNIYKGTTGSVPMLAVTPTAYSLPKSSIYAI